MTHISSGNMSKGLDQDEGKIHIQFVKICQAGSGGLCTFFCKYVIHKSRNVL